MEELLVLICIFLFCMLTICGLVIIATYTLIKQHSNKEYKKLTLKS